MTNALVSPDILTKHPDESVTYDMDFAPLLDDQETLTSVQLQPVADRPGLLFGTAAISGTTVVFRVLAGTLDTDYRVLAEVLTSEANIRACVGVLFVRG